MRGKVLHIKKGDIIDVDVYKRQVLDAEQARWHRRIVFTDPVLVDNTQGNGNPIPS